MLTPRLESILGLISYKTVADIGTDHAYIPIELLKRGQADHAIACDIRPGPLAIAEKNVKKYGLSDKIELRLGGGFSPIKSGETETAVIAGMGGEMIIKILSEDLEKTKGFRELILQPMNCQRELRLWLLENGFSIKKEELEREGFKVYNLMRVCFSGETKTADELELHLPKSLYSHPLFGMLLEKKRREFTKILKGNERAGDKDYDVINKYSELLKELDKI